MLSRANPLLAREEAEKELWGARKGILLHPPFQRSPILFVRTEPVNLPLPPLEAAGSVCHSNWAAVGLDEEKGGLCMQLHW